MMPLRQVSEEARAKVNLSLRILGRRHDGYHELQSLVVFADVGDHLRLVAGERFQINVTGPFGGQISGGNLIELVCEQVQSLAPTLQTGAFHLEKNLPVAAGIGGGSADAAAALRALRRVNPGLDDEVDWLECAAVIGADVPVCYVGQPQVMEGIGERLRPVSGMPEFSLLLVNSGAEISTAEIFTRLGATSFDELVDKPAFIDDGTFRDLDGLLDHMGSVGNDLEPPALEVLPEIAKVKALIAQNDGCKFAALSGSGATCFGVFALHDRAVEAEQWLQDEEPGWWVKAARVR